MTRREDRKEQITKQRETQILEAALLVFSREGFDKATVPDIAREAGVAVGTIYNYYKNKRDLLVAITNKYIIKPFTEVASHPPAEDDTSYISALMENRLDLGLEGMAKFLPLLAEVQRDPELRRCYTEQVLWPVMAMMEKYLKSRVEIGTFRDLNPAVVTRAIGGMVIGFMLIYRIEGQKSPLHNVSRKKLANEMANLVLKGLQSR